MDIQRRCQIAGTIAIVSVIVCGIIAGVEINTIRVGGPIQARNHEISELDADVLPPPAYIVEAFLETTLLARNPAALARHEAVLARKERDFRVSVARWKASQLSTTAIGAPFQQATAAADQFWTELDQVMLPALHRGDRQAASQSYIRLTALYDRHRHAIDRVVTAANQVRSDLMAHNAYTLGRAIALLTLIGLLLIAATIAGILYLLRAVLRPIGETALAMQRMAGGDLQLTLAGGDRRDEIGTMVQAVEVFRAAAQAERANARKQEIVVRELATALGQLGDGNLSYRIGDGLPEEYRELARSFDRSTERLTQALTRVADAAMRVKVSTTELRSSSDDLSIRTEQQAAALEQTAAAIHQITASVGEAAQGATRTDTIVRTVRKQTEHSSDVVRRAIEAMAKIERSSNEISEIISVIDGIAFQTNLLALNAGVEAARAGDAGRGFAVVAQEVRALAQRSAEAAKDVKSRVTASGALVHDGVDLVTETGEALETIFARIGEVSGLVSGIAQSADEQARGLNQVNVAVGEMDGVTQQNAAMVEQATAAARALAAEADALARDAGSFRLSQAGASAMPPPVRELRPTMPPAAVVAALARPGNDNPALAAR
ncbi:methyl-accepting chemotaxis protein [Sphingomonas sp. RIT328]|uniref:methyl-accepting chemotaxis protein n=1 Tax=Sphingomonas sp. RIT328 TaxID=1470591 RepID=UPI00045060B4|nr:methyl-accepting chemotaxis protein [Sphingomonas sp. RIT328]EZP52844.1 HAMP domain protein [Sphingomonas sp. RIT328]